MPQQNVVLKVVTREDVVRINEWLADSEISESWFGRYAYGNPAHLGYHPEEMAKASDEEWKRVFDNPEHRIESVYTVDGELLWKKEFGLLDSGYFRMPKAQWGWASSPVIHDGRVYVQADAQKGSFVAAFDVDDVNLKRSRLRLGRRDTDGKGHNKHSY